jgi:hypothetical protein
VLEIHDERHAAGRRARRRAVMAIVLTAGMLAAMASFSGVGFASGSHDNPAHKQYGKH